MCNTIKLRDLRGSEEQLSLDVYGFQLVKYIPRVSLDYPDNEQTRSYLTEMAAFLRNSLEAEIVITYKLSCNFVD